MLQQVLIKVGATKLNQLLSGKRTYLIGVAFIAQGVVAILQSEESTAEGLDKILMGAGLIYARLGARNEAAK